MPGLQNAKPTGWNPVGGTTDSEEKNARRVARTDAKILAPKRMTSAEALCLLTFDERDTFIHAPIPPPEDCESHAAIARDSFACVVEFGDRGSIRTLRVAIAHIAREREFQEALATLHTFTDEQSEQGACARRMVRAASRPAMPENVNGFLDALAAVAGSALLESRSRAGQRRGQIIKDLLNEAKVIELERAA